MRVRLFDTSLGGKVGQSQDFKIDVEFGVHIKVKKRLGLGRLDTRSDDASPDECRSS